MHRELNGNPHGSMNLRVSRTTPVSSLKIERKRNEKRNAENWGIPLQLGARTLPTPTFCKRPGSRAAQGNDITTYGHLWEEYLCRVSGAHSAGRFLPPVLYMFPPVKSRRESRSMDLAPGSCTRPFRTLFFPPFPLPPFFCPPPPLPPPFPSSIHRSFSFQTVITFW